MTITETETAVRYRRNGDDIVEPVHTDDDLIEVMRTLLQSDIVGEVVTRPISDWVPDKRRRNKAARDLVEETVEAYLGEEFDEHEALDMLRLLAPDLLDDEDIPALEVKGAAVAAVATVAGLKFTRYATDFGCTRENWLDLFVSADVTCTALREGREDPFWHDDDKVDGQRERALNVLAGISSHDPFGDDCGNCVVWVPMPLTKVRESDWLALGPLVIRAETAQTLGDRAEHWRAASAAAELIEAIEVAS